MRFLFRAFGGLVLLVLALALLGIAGITVKDALSEKAENTLKKKFNTERTYTAYVDRLIQTQINPKIIAYGEAKSWRSLELRATSSGRLVFLSKNFREGGMVEVKHYLKLIRVKQLILLKSLKLIFWMLEQSIMRQKAHFL